MANETIPSPAELYRLAYAPGIWLCPKCGFQLMKSTINANSGEIGTSETDRQSEPCPNDGEWMHPATYKELCEGLEKALMRDKGPHEVLTRLEERIAAYNAQQIAYEFQVSPQYLCDVRKRRRPITPALALQLGFEERISYWEMGK